MQKERERERREHRALLCLIRLSMDSSLRLRCNMIGPIGRLEDRDEI